jgi:hypothetical protein
VRQRGLTDALLAEDRQGVLTNFRANRVVFGEEQDLLEAFTYQSYDLGAAVLGNIGAFGYTVGVFNGPGSDAIDDTGGKSIAGRATLRVLKSAPIVLGAGVSTREFRVTSTPNIRTRAGTALEGDLEFGDFRKKGLHVIAEVTTGRNLAVADSLDHRNFLAGQAVAAWFVPVANRRVEGWELAGRVSWGDPRTGFAGDEGTLYTPGVNVYFSGRNRLMLNLDVYVPGGSQFSTQSVIRSQAQIFF